jgi:hypothetical protein
MATCVRADLLTQFIVPDFSGGRAEIMPEQEIENPVVVRNGRRRYLPSEDE